MENKRIDTLLELYDEKEPILNIAGAWYLQPRSIVFFYYEMENAAEKRNLATVSNAARIHPRVRAAH